MLTTGRVDYPQDVSHAALIVAWLGGRKVPTVWVPSIPANSHSAVVPAVSSASPCCKASESPVATRTPDGPLGCRAVRCRMKNPGQLEVWHLPVSDLRNLCQNVQRQLLHRSAVFAVHDDVQQPASVVSAVCYFLTDSEPTHGAGPCCSMCSPMALG